MGTVACTKSDETSSIVTPLCGLFGAKHEYSAEQHVSSSSSLCLE